MSRSRSGASVRSTAARALVISLALVLGACATSSSTIPTPQGGSAWEQRQVQLAAIESWTLKGRVAVETARDSGSATLTWEQNRDRYAMRISAPLAQGTFELRGDAGSATLRTPENRTLTAPDPQTLMRENLGWSLPVAGLKYWVRGLPAPGGVAGQLRVDDAGRLLDLEQDGWRISVLRYRQVADTELPDKLYMENSPLRMRVVIGEWQLHK
ncbi:MAG: lipoprotein insertase outer membrane protein LolB [Chromatiales bacterium]